MAVITLKFDLMTLTFCHLVAPTKVNCHTNLGFKTITNSRVITILRVWKDTQIHSHTQTNKQTIPLLKCYIDVHTFSFKCIFFQPLYDKMSDFTHSPVDFTSGERIADMIYCEVMWINIAFFLVHHTEQI